MSSGVEAPDLLDLIGQVYDAALDEKLWSAVAPQIAATFNAHSTAVQLRDTRNGEIALLAITENYNVAALSSYKSYYGSRDIWVQRATEIGLSNIVTSHDMVADEEFVRTEYYNDWCRDLGLFYIIGAMFPVADGQISGIGIHRTQGVGAFEEADKLSVAKFLPHFQRALQIRHQLATVTAERDAALDALEREQTAILVVDADARILYVNKQAEALLRRGDGLCGLKGRLFARDRRAGDCLAGLIRGAASVASGVSGNSGGALAILRGERLPLTVLVAPFRPARNGLGAPVPAAILFVRDPERPTPMSIAAQSLFGLTPAEGNIAGALAEGKSVDEIVSTLRISLNTARTHLKNIYAKTGTTRQAQLVSLLLQSVAVLTLS